MTSILTVQKNPIAVNVADFGASPLASAAQNNAAFAAAIAALPSTGGAIIVPNLGTYSISSPVVIDSDNISLIGLGTRLGSPTLQVSGDPSYTVIVGNTKNVNNVLLEGLNIQGMNSGTSTGGGINFRCTGGKIAQCRISAFGGTGINIAAFSGTIFEVVLDDVTLIQNGMNSGTPGDNLFIANTVTDFEVFRLISLGNSLKNTTRHCINCVGGPGKFLLCHEYFANQDGIHLTGNGNISVIGGEHETNGNYGITINSVTNPVVVESVHCFGNNVGGDVSASSTFTLINSMLESTNNGVYVTFASGVIANNILMGQGAKPIWLDAGCQYIAVHDNYIQNADPAIRIAGTNCAIHDNQCLAGGIAEVTGANSNDIHDNFIAAGKTITQIGTATKIRNNPGFNPVGKLTSQPGVPGSTSAYTNTNGVDCTVYITGGTVTVIAIGANATGLTSGAFRVPVGQTITLTYSVAPTWVWFGD